MGSIGFGYRAGPCFFAVKRMKNYIFFSCEKNPKKPSKVCVKITFSRCKILANHVRENEIVARKQKSKISLSKRFRFGEIKKKNNHEAFFFTVENSRK